MILVRDLTAVPWWVLLLAVFTLPALEASILLGLLVPGEIAVLLGGVLAHQGKVPLGAVMVAAVAGAVIGDNIGYAVGVRMGSALYARAPDPVTRRLDAARAFVRRFGAAAVLLGRWTAFLRALVPSVAGASGVPYRRFAAFNVLGGALWGVGVALIGYLADAAYHQAERTIGLAWMVATLVLLTAALVATHRGRRMPDRRRPPTPSPSSPYGSRAQALYRPRQGLPSPSPHSHGGLMRICHGGDMAVDRNRPPPCHRGRPLRPLTFRSPRDDRKPLASPNLWRSR
ncbi:DedA family protein [Georgenia sp. SYP-B2076]|uniref:DedA family protein n=1 Tax=Georgenia sp. SYP-B2076 TaxID=2495881 RepID=UPI000F8F708E|nr:DedA family protein [Georgenia sp. SYP-B2076]